MIVSEAALAPTSPPETGASRYSQPSALIRLANSLVSTGEIELMSTTILPPDRPSATPSLPNRTFSTSGVSGTMMMMISAFSATSLPLAQTLRPCGQRRRRRPYVVDEQLVTASLKIGRPSANP